MLKDPASIALAAFFSFLGIVISIYQILCHLRNYTEPLFQRYIIRIIFMVPVYAIGSFCSLQWRDGAIYFDTLRDCYEAWIIYNFSALLLAYVGGPGAVVVKAEGKMVHPSWSHMTCCLPAMQVDGFFLRRCKQGTVQFVLLKPVMAALTLILYAAGAYTDGDMSPRNGYFYLSIMYNVCYTLALYGLILFWIGASELLQPFNPLLKFVLVKTVVFLTFWQGIGISAINSMGKISDPEDGKALQNFMICTEMAVAGIALLYAFPHKEYQIGGTTTSFRVEAFMHAISVKDVVCDAIHVFAPSYSDYVLYSDGGPADNEKRKKFRGQKGTGGDHPKAGKPMTKMDEGGGDGDGRRSKTPNGGGKLLDANRNQAILLDSDSDGIDSDDEGSIVHSSDSGGSDAVASGDERSPQAPGQRTASYTAATQLETARSDKADKAASQPAGMETAQARKKLQKRASSKRMQRVGNGVGEQQQQRERRTSRGRIKASYPAGTEPIAAPGAAAGDATPNNSGTVSLPAALKHHGAILSDSDDSDKEQEPQTVPAAKAGTTGLLGPQHVDSTAAAPAAPAAAAPVSQSHKPIELAALAAAVPPRLTALMAPPSRGKAAAVRQAVAGAAQAAGRAMAAAQAAGSRQPGEPTFVSALPAGTEGGLRSSAAVPRVSGVVDGVAVDAGAAARWEPTFPGPAAEAGLQDEEQQQVDGNSGRWAEQGWSNVVL